MKEIGLDLTILALSLNSSIILPNDSQEVLEGVRRLNFMLFII
ncbi:hypothetical protein MGA3_16091 [Bacillus methanolicus MGA3]|nr:hypothetical protein MGA3_16091 [Bacillus methanolicus MGA3]